MTRASITVADIEIIGNCKDYMNTCAQSGMKCQTKKRGLWTAAMNCTRKMKTKKERKCDMRKNPCRHCSLHTEYKNRCYHGYSEQCYTCKDLASHKAYLKTRKKYDTGEPITNIRDLLNETWVIWNGRAKHIEVVKSLTLRTVLQLLDKRILKKAVPKSTRKVEVKENG